MDDYLLEKLRCDARHVLDLANQAKALEHMGLRGRFREILIDNFLTPWLPPYVKCGTGMIISAENKKRESTQDDIIIYDESLAPPVLASENSKEGVFLFNSVLARIEVKSKVKKSDIEDFVTSSKEISVMTFSVMPGNPQKPLIGPLNLLFAFDTDLTKSDDLIRLREILSENQIDEFCGLVSTLCVANKGFWKLGIKDKELKCWQKLINTQPEDNLVWFLGCLSSACFHQHSFRVGLDPKDSVESGVGTYLSGNYANID